MTQEQHITNILAQLKEEFPPHAALIDAMSPTMLLRERILEEQSPILCSASQKLLQHKALTLSSEEHNALRHLTLQALDALRRGFPDAEPLWQSLQPLLEQHEELIAELFHVGRNSGVHVEDMPEAKDFSQEIMDALELLAAQLSRICSALAVCSLPPQEEKEGLGHRLCPYCGARPEFSFIYGEEGKRFLSCSQCGRHWRYDRSACPQCGPIGATAIRHLYVDTQPELRAALCDACHSYLLEVDLRKRALSLELAPVLSTVMGHLDAIASQEGAHAVSLLTVTNLSAQEAGHA